jgi:DNA topoisomerase-1
VEAGDTEFLEVLKGFYDSFSERLEKAKESMLSVKGVGIETELKCPECQEKLNIKVGKNGPFISCNKYPECSFSRNYTRDEKGVIHLVEPDLKQAEGKFCDKCNSQMVLKQGRYGEFLACSNYPDCKNTQSITAGGSGDNLGISCPEEGCEGEIIEKKSRRGKVFYGCNKYPDCKFASWDMPVSKECPDCGAPFLVEKTTKKEGRFLKCNAEGCTYKELLDD